jgi:hypothetical protein
VILGLDVRRYDDEVTFQEYWRSAFKLERRDLALDGERGRRSAIDALARLEAEGDLLDYEWVLITW